MEEQNSDRRNSNWYSRDVQKRNKKSTKKQAKINWENGDRTKEGKND